MSVYGLKPATARPPTPAFIGASWTALGVGMLSYAAGLWNAQIPFDQKAFYLVMLMFGLFSAVSLQKTIRDRLEGIPSTAIYFGLCWTSLCTCLVILTISLWKAEFELSVKGFYAMAYLLSLFAAVAVQKNVRDVQPVTTSAHGDSFANPTQYHG